MKMLMEFRIFGYVLSDDGKKLHVSWCLPWYSDTPDDRQAAIDMMIYNARNTDLIIQSVRYLGITNYYHESYRWCE